MQLSFIKHFFIQNKNKKKRLFTCIYHIKNSVNYFISGASTARRGYKCLNYFDSHCLIKLITFKGSPYHFRLSAGSHKHLSSNLN